MQGLFIFRYSSGPPDPLQRHTRRCQQPIHSLVRFSPRAHARWSVRLVVSTSAGTLGYRLVKGVVSDVAPVLVALTSRLLHCSPSPPTEN